MIHIRKSAFQNCRNLEKVILPDYLADIGNGAFCQCKNLKEVIFPRKLEKIDKDAFLGCICLKQAVLPDSITQIGEGAFQGCEMLEYVRLPKSLTELKAYLFSYCIMLSEIKLPETVTQIQTKVFYHCTHLKKLHLPDGMEFLSDDAVDTQSLCTLTYKDITFTNKAKAFACMHMINTHRLDVRIPMTEKISILIQLYYQNPEEEALLLYLKEQFPEIVHILIKENHAELICKIIHAGQIVQKETIDKLIRYAIKEKAYETQVMLTNYKKEQFGFESIEDKAKGLLLD